MHAWCKSCGNSVDSWWLDHVFYYNTIFLESDDDQKEESDLG